jgi:aspartate-semialdehyde dehydrogenase
MKNVLFIGGSGQLGSKVLSIFSQFHVVNVDFNAHEQAKRNILFKKENSVAENNKFALENVKNFGIKYDAILVTAGGWVGGSYRHKVPQSQWFDCFYWRCLGLQRTTA